MWSTNWRISGKTTITSALYVLELIEPQFERLTPKISQLGNKWTRKFLGGDWRRRERRSGIGEKEKCTLIFIREERTAALSVTGTAARPLNPTPPILTGRKASSSISEIYPLSGRWGRTVDLLQFMFCYVSNLTREVWYKSSIFPQYGPLMWLNSLCVTRKSSISNNQATK